MPEQIVRLTPTEWEQTKHELERREQAAKARAELAAAARAMGAPATAPGHRAEPMSVAEYQARQAG